MTIRKSISMNASGLTGQKLREFMKHFPSSNDVKVDISIRVTPPDRPFDAEVTTITATWNEEEEK